MAAKAKAKPKGKVKAAARKANIHKAKPKGLQLTTAQHAAYNKAFNAKARAVRNQIALRASATQRRKALLGAANSMTRQYNRARGSAQAAAVAANASRMTWVQARLAHQNTALLARAEHNMGRHAALLSRAQYAQAGEKAFAHHAVMATVTQKQAVSAQQAFFRKVVRTARKVGARKTKFKRGPNSAIITKAAKAAGLAAAKRVKSAPPPKSGRGRGRPVGSGKGGGGRGLGRPVGSGKGGGKATTVKNVKSLSKKGSASKKAPAAPAKSRTAPMYGLAYAAAQAKKEMKPLAPKQIAWVGDEFTPNCVITALANQLLSTKGVRADEASIRELTEACPEPTIEDVLWKAWLIHWPRNDRTHIGNYMTSPWRGDPDVGGLIIGYEVQTEDGPGDHAALALANGDVVSWGVVIQRDREVPIEEAWEVQWVS